MSDEAFFCSNCGEVHKNLAACPQPFCNLPEEEKSMNQTSETIRLLIKDVHQNAIKHGFWEVSQNVGEKVALIHTELSEFFEGYRKDNFRPDEHCPEFTNQTIELADTVIRILDLAGWLHMHNLGNAIQAKMLYNQTRERLHGKKF